MMSKTEGKFMHEFMDVFKHLLLCGEEKEQNDQIETKTFLYESGNIKQLQNLLQTPYQVAEARKNALIILRSGLSSPMVNYVVKPSVEAFLSSTNKDCNKNCDEISLSSQWETKLLYQVLTFISTICKLDVTLSEEMAKDGSHIYLSKVIYLDSSSIIDTKYGLTETIEEREVLDTIILPQQHRKELDEDLLTEIQDLACDIVHDSRMPHLTFPVKVSPFTGEELLKRLPLQFHVQSPYYTNDSDEIGAISKRMSFLVQQVTDRQSAQEDVGFVMWPSAVVLSSWLLANPSILFNKQTIELGAGCGLTGLVASQIVAEYEQSHRIHQHSTNDQSRNEEKKDGDDLDIMTEESKDGKGKGNQVTMTDFNTKVLTNLDRNIALNGLNHVAQTMHLDFYVQSGLNHQGGWSSSNHMEDSGVDDLYDANDTRSHIQPPVDLILAADVICKPSDSIAASKTIYDVLKPGGEAIIVSANAKHRFGVDIFEKECASLGLDVKSTNVSDLCEGRLLTKSEECHDACGIRQTSGYVDGMSLTMFRVHKSIQQK